jgi:hypothetical protein
MKSLRIESVFNHTSGYGSVARSFATELQKQQRENIDLKLYNITQNFRSQEEKQFSYLWDDAKMVPKKIYMQMYLYYGLLLKKY